MVSFSMFELTMLSPVFSHLQNCVIYAHAFISFAFESFSELKVLCDRRVFSITKRFDQQSLLTKTTTKMGPHLMGASIKVVATGVIALCLVLSALLYIQSAVSPSMQGFGDKFFGLTVALIFIVIILALAGVKIKLP